MCTPENRNKCVAKQHFGVFIPLWSSPSFSHYLTLFFIYKLSSWQLVINTGRSLCEVKLKPLLKGHVDTHTHTKCENSYAHLHTDSTIVQSGLKHITTEGDEINTVWLEKNQESVKAWKMRGNTQSPRVSEMFTSPTVIWSDAIIPCLFQEERSRENRKTLTYECHQIPLGHFCLFWRSRAM